MLYVGAMANTLYLSLYADKRLKGENQSTREPEPNYTTEKACANKVVPDQPAPLGAV